MLPIRRRGQRDLPPPAIASSSNRSGSGGRNKKQATFEDDGISGALKVHWSRFVKRLGAGSALSESLIEVSESNTGSESATRQYIRGRAATEAAEDTADDEEVDETVVDNEFWKSVASKSVTQPSEHTPTPEKSGASGTHMTTDGESVHDHQSRLAFCLSMLAGTFYRLKNACGHFFFTSFYDAASEAQYRRETYYQGKSLAVWGSLFIVINWVLACALIKKETLIDADKYFYWAICPVFVAPLPFMVIYDLPKTYPIVYQIFVSISLWSWAGYNLIIMQLCGYYNENESIMNCGGPSGRGGVFGPVGPSKEFIGIFYYTSAFPVVALFALGQNRLMATIFAVFTGGLTANVIHNKSTWIRNTVNFVIYMSFLVWIHYQKENAERRLFTMRDRLKVQYRATQQAQVRESKAADSKKRFSSYIFHEVRVPLNTALLAVQNMEASGVFRKDDIEFTALEGSLTMMSKVLNDVLDFNRMDSGRFESVSKPYAFHKVMRSMLVPLQLTANARGLELITTFDPQIDVVARLALHMARSQTADNEKKNLQLEDENDGLVLGDEHRLRQIVTNLTSNACKFTPSGGKIWVRTKLILPGDEDGGLAAAPELHEALEAASAAGDLESGGAANSGEKTAGLSVGQLRLHDSPTGSKPILDKIVIRIEVEDTGVGIRRKDMVDNRLFSPYVQTDIGRFQGGKGTGLGLALSKHIIRLSGGRLGVKSKRDSGSTFWVELQMGVGQKILDNQSLHVKDGMVAQSFEFSQATTEAFKPPESEGVTPSTVRSEPSSTQDDSSAARSHGSSSAMQHLMEHSGDIELLPRPHRTTSEQSSLQGSEQHPTSTHSNDSRPTKSTPDSGLSSVTVRPHHVELPPPLFSNTSGSATLGSEVVAPYTPPTRPSLQAASSSTAASPSPSDTLTHTPLNVLVVDDDGLTRKLMSRMLTRIGCSVESAENGKMALDMITSARNPFTFAPTPPGEKPQKVQTPYLGEEHKYDVVFLDNQMPVMSGVEMVRKLRELRRRDFIVGVTGNALKEDQEEYIDAGVDAVLTKPVKENSLKNFLQVADERRKAGHRSSATSTKPP